MLSLTERKAEKVRDLLWSQHWVSKAHYFNSYCYDKTLYYLIIAILNIKYFQFKISLILKNILLQTNRTNNSITNKSKGHQNILINLILAQKFLSMPVMLFTIENEHQQNNKNYSMIVGSFNN